MKTIALASTSALLIIGLALGWYQQNLNNQMENNTTIFELAINKAKDGQWDQFLKSRAAFVDVLSKEDATLNEGKWKPFFTFGEMNLDPVLIGMTHWSSMEGFGEAAQRLLPQKEAQAYFSSFDPLVYALLEPMDGKSFDMGTIKKEGLVVEFAVRSANSPDAFGEKRERFFNSLESFDGYQFAREFKYYELDEKGMPQLQENTQAVIIVWDNAEVFQAAVPTIMSSEESKDFMGSLDVKSYFAAMPQ